MATLYEIDREILACVDTETGEIIDNEKLEALQVERNEKIEAVALWVKNLASDAEAYKAEKDAFAEKEKAAKNKIESLKNWLSFALGGQKFTPESKKVNITFRRSETVEIENEEQFVQSALLTNRDDLLTFKPAVPNKTAIKTAIKDGQVIEGATIVEKQNIQIK